VVAFANQVGTTGAFALALLAPHAAIRHGNPAFFTGIALRIAATLGQAYRSYRARTKRFIPFVV
jgi:protein-S-isoprenylcysteine O-methyltransferase Ste14